MLITHHRDVPGVIGRVGTILGRFEINIAGMEVGRHHRGDQALMVVNVDNIIPEASAGRDSGHPGNGKCVQDLAPPRSPSWSRCVYDDSTGDRTGRLTVDVARGACQTEEGQGSRLQVVCLLWGDLCRNVG